MRITRRSALASLLTVAAGAAVTACTPPPAPPARRSDEALPGDATATADRVAATPQPFAAIDPYAQIKQLGRGVNFGNALEAPTEGEWGMTLEERFFDLVKEGGFSSIQLPTKWSAHAAREAPFAIDGDFFARVDWAVDNALRRGLSIVVNMHHYDELFEDVAGERDRFTALWEQIADRYKDRPAQVVLEPLNEPHGALTAGLWQRLFDDALAAIRKTNPERNVVFTGADWGGPSSLKDMKRPDDPHLIATFHYYLPFQFTHQGAEWVEGSEAWKGTQWLGKSNDRVNVDFDLDQAAKWGKDNDIPLWMGEFGSYGRYADMDSRERWTAYVARGAESRGMAWAYWEFGAGFGVYDRAADDWVEPIHRALVPR
jgi:endoglucanase